MKNFTTTPTPTSSFDFGNLIPKPSLSVKLFDGFFH